FQNARGLLGELPKQKRPSAAADIDQLAIDQKSARRFGCADIKRRSNRSKRLFEDAAEFDGDRADVSLYPSISSVDARPPGRSLSSTTSVCSPACARRAAAQRPPAPAPITTASNP